MYLSEKHMKVGVFDSGIGGITILREVAKRLQNIEIIYLCDNKNLPYGNKTVEFIKRRLSVVLQHFYARGCKVVFIGCHSAASVYLRYKEELEVSDMHVIDTISPTCAHLNKMQCLSIGIMATDRTIRDQTYNKHLNGHEILEFPSSSLASIIEMQSHHDTDATVSTSEIKESLYKLLQEILGEERLKVISKMILACTHYPHIIDEIKRWIEQHTQNCEVIDPANVIVSSADFDSIFGERFYEGNTKTSSQKENKISFFATGNTDALLLFCKHSALMKEKELSNFRIEQVEL